MTQQLMQLGVLFALIGIALIFFSLFSGASKENVKYSVFGMIGPFPFGFGNDKKLFLFTVILAAAVFIVTSAILRNR